MQNSAHLWRDIAVLRGLESGRPPGGRLVDDPVSLRLLPRRWRWLLRLLEATGMADSILARRERDLPGVIANLLCRTRYMDDVLRSALDDGDQYRSRYLEPAGRGLSTLRAERVALARLREE